MQVGSWNLVSKAELRPLNLIRPEFGGADSLGSLRAQLVPWSQGGWPRDLSSDDSKKGPPRASTPAQNGRERYISTQLESSGRIFTVREKKEKSLGACSKSHTQELLALQAVGEMEMGGVSRSPFSSWTQAHGSQLKGLSSTDTIFGLCCWNFNLFVAVFSISLLTLLHECKRLNLGVFFLFRGKVCFNFIIILPNNNIM